MLEISLDLLKVGLESAWLGGLHLDWPSLELKLLIIRMQLHSVYHFIDVDSLPLQLLLEGLNLLRDQHIRNHDRVRVSLLI